MGGSAAGQAGSPALQCNPRWLAPQSGATAFRIGVLGLQPFGLPLPAPPILSAVLPFGFAQIGVLGAYPPSAYSPACARQFGCAFGQKPARLVSVALSPNPPETRKVVGRAPFPSFSRSASTDYRLLALRAKTFVLADKDCVFDSNPALAGGMRTDKLFSLHSFISVTKVVVYSLRFVASFRNVLLLSVALPSADHRQQGVLGRFAPYSRKTTTDS